MMGLAGLIGVAGPVGDDVAPFDEPLAEQVRRATAAMLAGCAALRLLPEHADRLPALLATRRRRPLPMPRPSAPTDLRGGEPLAGRGRPEPARAGHP
jgi:hypothetical protein